MHISSHLTTKTLCPFRSSFATIDAKRPSMWWRASTKTRFARAPEPETNFFSPACFYASQGFADAAEDEMGLVLGWRRLTIGCWKLSEVTMMVMIVVKCVCCGIEARLLGREEEAAVTMEVEGTLLPFFFKFQIFE